MEDADLDLRTMIMRAGKMKPGRVGMVTQRTS